MKCFDVVQTVLDATYAEVPDENGSRDQSIAHAIAETAEQYGSHLMEEGGPDFENPATRFGYVYKYVPAHAHWLYELIDMCPQVAAAFEKGKVRVTCIGGGPGSELVGILKYLDENSIECKLFVELIDGCEAWKSTWGDLAFELEWDDALHTDYVIQDVADKATWSSPSKIEKADLIIFSFFVSEIFHLDTSERYLEEMLSRAKPGALVLVNDNRTSDVYDLMDSLAKKHGFKTLLADEGTRKIYDWGEKMDALKKYAEKFNVASRLTGKMFWRVYAKQ